MILEPTGLWFMDDCVIRGVTKSTKTNFVGPIPTSWTQASHAQREAWFNNFRLSFAWSPSQEQNVRIRYNDVGTRRYRDVIWKVVRRPKEPDHMKGDKYEGLIKHTKSEAFQKKSKQASLNKRGGKEDAVNEPTHYAGSRSFWNRMLGRGKKKSQPIATVPELFLDTHSRVDGKGVRTWTKPKDKQLYEAFEREKAANPEKEDNDIWYELVDGFKKGHAPFGRKSSLRRDDESNGPGEDGREPPSSGRRETMPKWAKVEPGSSEEDPDGREKTNPTSSQTQLKSKWWSG
ncbi:uncharacterized protein LOC141628202 [Silene latifolia]|uniref:uncharacterized protein LOC141628202 n=1 Tax=Silene latifolia TaxID=37657 RepID=UPI003D779919